jgi:hypothetical protein
LFADAVSGVVESAQQAGAAKQAQREVSFTAVKDKSAMHLIPTQPLLL